MDITYNWQYNNIQVIVQSGTLSNVVISTQWVRSAASSDGVYQTFTQGEVGFLPPNPSDFIDFQNLTKDEMTSWVVGILGQSYVDGVDATMAAQLEAQANPTVVIKPAPWNPANAQPLSNPVQ